MTNPQPPDIIAHQAGAPPEDLLVTQEPHAGRENNDPFATPNRAAEPPAQDPHLATEITPGAATLPGSPGGHTPGQRQQPAPDGTTGTWRGGNLQGEEARQATEIANSNRHLQTFLANTSGGESGPLAKASLALGAGGSLLLAATIAKQLYDTWMAEGTPHTPAARLQTFGEQPAPFVFLAIRHPDNRLIIVHGIKKLVVPFGHQHPNTGNILAFINEATGGAGLPTIAKLTPLDFGPARDWLHPTVTDIMNADAGQIQVLQVTEENTFQSTPKIIPIPLFLVPFFLNRGNPMTAIQGFQAFYTLFTTAEDSIKNCTRHIFNFLLIASGHDDTQEFEPEPASQLAIQVEALQLDPVLGHWAINQFGGIWQIANLHDATIAATNQQHPLGTGETIQAIQSPPGTRQHHQEGNTSPENHNPGETREHLATRAMGTHQVGTPATMTMVAPAPDATIMAQAAGAAMTPAQG